MEKRYQVFVSSTYADLKDERQKVTQTLMELDCIPAGMELFPAVDEDQWAFIKKVIDDCDYYVLIIGGRYGSTSPNGISYTEKEYDYACQRGIRVLAFIHRNPKELSAERSEFDPTLRERLELFRERASRGRLVKFWNRADELPGLLALSLPKTIKAYPAVGWVRATAATSMESLEELNRMRKQLSQAKNQLKKLTAETEREPLFAGLESLDSKTKIGGSSMNRESHERFSWILNTSWRDAFAMIAPYLLCHPTEAQVRIHLTEQVSSQALTASDAANHSLSTFDFETLKVQFAAHALVRFTRSHEEVTGTGGLLWSLTEHGLRVLFESRAVRALSENTGSK